MPSPLLSISVARTIKRSLGKLPRGRSHSSPSAPTRFACASTDPATFQPPRTATTQRWRGPSSSVGAKVAQDTKQFLQWNSILFIYVFLAARFIRGSAGLGCWECPLTSIVVFCFFAIVSLLPLLLLCVGPMCVYVCDGFTRSLSFAVRYVCVHIHKLKQRRKGALGKIE